MTFNYNKNGVNKIVYLYNIYLPEFVENAHTKNLNLLRFIIFVFDTYFFRLIVILIHGTLRSFTVTVMFVLLKAIAIYYTVVIFNYTMTIPNFSKMCQRFYYGNTQKFESLSEYFGAPENYYSRTLSYFAPHSPTTAIVGKGLRV